jgi:hypothetical protein
MKIGRNEPCPCGSGKKYKECCLAADTEQQGPTGLPDIMAEIKKEIMGREFDSLSEIQAAVDQICQTQNRMQPEAFCGLSPEQMHRFLHFPFDSSDIVRFSDTFQKPPEAPVMTLFSFLADGCGDSGLKATAKGYLPQRFCQDVAIAFWGKEGYEQKTLGSGVRKELDFNDLHVVRLVAEMAGFVRKYRGRFVLTKKCRQLLAAPGNGKLYLELFKAYTRKFNWGYRDAYEEIGIIQQSFLFSLFLLHRFGAEFRGQAFYEDRFLQAFPHVLQEVPEPPYRTKEEYVSACYSLRTMERFALFFGLIERNILSDEILKRRYEIKKRPLLDELVSFNAPKS